MSLFTVDPKLCKGDGICVEECPVGIIEIRRKGDLPSPAGRAEEICIRCGHCVAVCPHGAFSLGTMSPKDCSPIHKEILPGFEKAAELLKSRRSIRAYREAPVKRETLLTLIDTARYAPSGSNSQPVRWLVIEDRKEVGRLAAWVVDWMKRMVEESPEVAVPAHFDRVIEAWNEGKDRIFRGAPHVIVAFGLKALPAAQPASIIALTYLELAAYAMGLGPCWAGYFMRASQSYPPLLRWLDLPDGHQVFGAMMIGYPKYDYHRIPLRDEPRIIWR